MSEHIHISPSLMTMDLDKFKEQISFLDKKVDSFHIDIMDGHFVPNLSLSPWFITEARKLTTKEISTEDRILEIKSRLSTLPKTFNFENLVADCHNVHEVIVTFLAILDMAKDHYLVFSTDDNDEIWFRRGENNE